MSEPLTLRSYVKDVSLRLTVKQGAVADAPVVSVTVVPYGEDYTFTLEDGQELLIEEV